MRILYFGHTGSPHFRAWPRFFAARGHEVHVQHIGMADAVPMTDVHWHRPARLAAVGRAGIWQLAAAEMAQVIRRARPHVVHSHQVFPPGYLATLAHARPHVATAWGSEVLLTGGIWRLAVKLVARRAHLLTADSMHLLDALSAHGAPRDRLRFVPWGVDRAWCETASGLTRAQAARRAGLPANRLIVLAPRGSMPVYRPETVVAAIARAASWVPEILGIVKLDAASDAERLATVAEGYGAREAIRFEPKSSHAEMALLLRAAVTVVSVPESDSAPTTVFEALALGTPCVVSDLPWVHESAHRQVLLRTVSVGDEVALAREIAALAVQPPSDEIATTARLVRREFDRERLFGQIEVEYERLARRNE